MQVCCMQVRYVRMHVCSALYLQLEVPYTAGPVEGAEVSRCWYNGVSLLVRASGGRKRCHLLCDVGVIGSAQRPALAQLRRSCCLNRRS